MSPSYTLNLIGHLTAVTPLATTLPAASNQNKKDGPTPLPRMPFHFEGNSFEAPYFPGSGIRGRLRRIGVGLVRACFEEGFPLPTFYYLTIGGVKGKGGDDKASFKKSYDNRVKNPLIGLFGSGDPFHGGRAWIGHATPSEPISVGVIGGVRSDDFTRGGGEKLELLAPEDVALWEKQAIENRLRSQAEATIRNLEQKLRRAKKDEAEKIRNEIKRLTDQAEAHGQAAGSTTSVQLPLPGYEVIPPGTKLQQRITLDAVNEAELGLFFHIMKVFAINPVIGAKTAHHCGVVSGEWQYQLLDARTNEVLSRGEIALVPYEGLKMDIPLVEGAMKAFAERLARNEFDFAAPGRPGKDAGADD